MTATTADKAACLARIETVEAGAVDGDGLLAAWRDVTGFPLNLRTRMRRAIAASASLPPKLAEEVLVKFPAELFQNPALPLLVMEQPRLFSRAPKAFWTAVLAAPEISPALMPALVASCPPWQLHAMARRPEFEAGDALSLLHKLTMASPFENLPALHLSDEHALLLCQQWNERLLHLPPDLVTELRAKQDDRRYRALLVRAAAVDPAEAMQLRRAGGPFDYLVDKALAGRPDLAPDDIATLFTTNAGDPRVAAAGNPSAPVATLHEALRDHNPAVVLAAVTNPSLPRAEWEGYLAKGAARRRVGIAQRLDLTAGDFDRLAAAGESEVRLHLAENPTTPAAVIERLAHDLVEEVRDRAKAHPAYVAKPEEEAVATAVESAAAPAKTKRTKRPAEPLLVRARRELVGNTSGGQLWEETLRWVEKGGTKPKRVPLGQADRKRLGKDGLALLGDDPRKYDAEATRLLGALVGSLDALPTLRGAAHREVASVPSEHRTMAEQWMTKLVEAGFTEAEALGFLCDVRGGRRAGDGDYVRRLLAAQAVRARLGSLVALFEAAHGAKNKARLASALAAHIAEESIAVGESLPPAVSLYALPAFRDALEGNQHHVLARRFGYALVEELRAVSPEAATHLLTHVAVHHGWDLDKILLAEARAAQGKTL